MKDLELFLQRRPTRVATTLGVLDVDDLPFCFTLEDEVREDPNPSTPANEDKVYGKTAIPPGRYELVINFSEKFQKNMIEITNVPGFTGIRIHSLNTAEDTLGCVGVGNVVESYVRISGGSTTMPRLFKLVQDALSQGRRAFITVANWPAPTTPSVP